MRVGRVLVTRNKNVTMMTNINYIYWNHFAIYVNIELCCMFESSIVLLYIVVQSPTDVWFVVAPWTAAHQASLSLTISRSLPGFMSIASMMPSSHLTLWLPLLLLPSIFPNIRDFSNELALHVRWPNSWSFGFSVSPSNEYSELTSFKIDCLVSLLSKGRSGVFCSTTVRKHQCSGTLPSLWSSSHNHTWPLRRPLLAEWCLCFSTHCLGLS